MTSSDRGRAPVHLIVVVDSVADTAEALVRAVRAWHPDWMMSAAWAGDPQFRPTAPTGTAWTAAVPSEIDLCRVTDDDRAWLAGLTAARPILSGELPTPVLVLLAGAVAVAGPLDALTPTDDDGIVVVPRLLAAPTQGHPDAASLFEIGWLSPSTVGFGLHAAAALESLLEGLLTDVDVAFGRRLEAATTSFPHRRCLDPAVGASCWRWPLDRPPVLIDAPEFSDGSPALLDGTVAGPPRISLAEGDRLTLVRSVADQLGGSGAPIRLPGAIRIDATVRRLARREAHEELRPWTRAKQFRDLLDRRYWPTLIDARPDLAARFGSGPALDATFDTDGFRAWVVDAVARGEAPLLLDPPAIADTTSALPVTGCRTGGLNVVGYLDRQSGVGAVGRAMVEMLAEAGIPHTSIAYQRTSNPVLASPPLGDRRVEFATTLACVNGDQMANLRADHPELFGPGRAVVGYWFWELSTVRGGPSVAVDTVQEIWAATRFMADAFAEHGVPVRVVPFPIAPPNRSDVTRASFPPLADADGRFVFGVVLDHLSVTARKNPVGAIEAFRRAFAPDEGPLLVIKTINADACWREHERLLLAAAQHPDVVVWDAHLPISDHFAFIGHLDALVSLHRSEGLGLHLAEAMWMGVPVIATRYSGNLDFMDDESALLVEADLVEVGADGGWAYPAEATWASPRIDLAADAMRRLVDQPDLAAAVGRAARERMEAQHRNDSRALVAQLTALAAFAHDAS